MIEYALIGLITLIHLLILILGLAWENRAYKSQVSEVPDEDPRCD